MARTDRLFRLLQALRVLPAPVTAARLAEETGVSLRSLYRDIDSLRAGGAVIEGERGFGYRLIEDGALPPQMFSRIEIEALVLGLSQARQIGDPALAQAATAALAKVAATLPDASQQQVLHAVSLVHGFEERVAVSIDVATIREGCWREEAVTIGYADKEERVTTRTIWPLAIVYVDRKLVVLAWCCLREAYRMFRVDRIATVHAAGTSFRPKRVALLRAYMADLKG
jgi:predicted DNA-binding transcriptional regulator YafY